MSIVFQDCTLSIGTYYRKSQVSEICMLHIDTYSDNIIDACDSCSGRKLVKNHRSVVTAALAEASTIRTIGNKDRVLISLPHIAQKD